MSVCSCQFPQVASLHNSVFRVSSNNFPAGCQWQFIFPHRLPVVPGRQTSSDFRPSTQTFPSGRDTQSSTMQGSFLCRNKNMYFVIVTDIVLFSSLHCPSWFSHLIDNRSKILLFDVSARAQPERCFQRQKGKSNRKKNSPGSITIYGEKTKYFIFFAVLVHLTHLPMFV